MSCCANCSTPDATPLVVNGRNTSIAAAFQTIWGSGVPTPAGLYPFPVAPLALEVVSDNPADSAAGTGAQEVSVTVLNAALEESTVLVATNGATAVPIGTWFRVNDFRVTRCGAGGQNAGNLSIRRVAAPAIGQAFIANSGFGVAEQLVRTTPANTEAIVESLTLIAVPTGNFVQAQVVLFDHANNTRFLRYTATANPLPLLPRHRVPPGHDWSVQLINFGTAASYTGNAQWCPRRVS